MPVIEVRDIYKYYNIGEHNEVRAIDGVSFSINEADFVAIVGPSGSGKSTLLHMVGCLDNPTRGLVVIDGVDVSKLDDDGLSKIRLNKIGFIFQTFNLIPGVSAVENVVMPLVPYNLSENKKEQAKRLLHDFGILARAEHDPSKLSGGEKQRVAIARSLINNPRIILADEPTGQLDSKTGREIIKLMHKLNEEKKITFVIVTHDESLLQYVKRIIRLKDGKVVSDELNGKLHRLN